MAEDKVKAPPGPWLPMAGMPTNIIGPNGQRVARCDFDGDFDDPRAVENARLIAAAPAMELALRMISLGIASIKGSTPRFAEFCFDGLRYSMTDGDWNGVIGVIGWDRCEAAIAKAGGRETEKAHL